MKVIKTYFVEKESFIVAANEFWHDLNGFNLNQQEKLRFLEEFKEAFQRSEDYDLASLRVSDDVMRYVENRRNSKVGAFKSMYQHLTKQEKGDIVIFEGEEYRVNDVQEDAKDGQNLYKLCHFVVVGPDAKLQCKMVYADEDELDIK